MGGAEMKWFFFMVVFSQATSWLWGQSREIWESDALWSYLQAWTDHHPPPPPINARLIVRLSLALVMTYFLPKYFVKRQCSESPLSASAPWRSIGNLTIIFRERGGHFCQTPHLFNKHGHTSRVFEILLIPNALVVLSYLLTSMNEERVLKWEANRKNKDELCKHNSVCFRLGVAYLN